MAGRLIVVRGLPGVGKTTLARALAARLEAVYLRVDSLEQALRSAVALPRDIADAGYRALAAAAEDNLRLGRVVVADAVVPVLEARRGLCAAAERAGANTFEVEVVCSDRKLHKLRAAARANDIPGLVLPSWEEIEQREYQTWPVECTIDTARASPAQCSALLLQRVQAWCAQK